MGSFSPDFQQAVSRQSGQFSFLHVKYLKSLKAENYIFSKFKEILGSKQQVLTHLDRWNWTEHSQRLFCYCLEDETHFWEWQSSKPSSQAFVIQQRGIITKIVSKQLQLLPDPSYLHWTYCPISFNDNDFKLWSFLVIGHCIATNSYRRFNKKNSTG